MGLRNPAARIARDSCRSPRAAAGARGLPQGLRDAGRQPLAPCPAARLRSYVFLEVDRIHNPDDGGIHSRQLLPERSACRLALDHDEHALADSRAYRVDRQQRDATWLAAWSLGLDEQQLGP